MYLTEKTEKLSDSDETSESDGVITFYARIRKANRLTIPLNVVEKNKDKLIEGVMLKLTARLVE